MPIEDLFRDRFDQTATVVASAPGRVNLIGEHLDYNGGLSMPIALTARTTVAASSRDDGLLVFESRQSGARVDVPMAALDEAPEGFARYVAGVLWALAARGVTVPGANLLVDGQVPLGSGLSSSAALEVAVGYAVRELAREHADRADRAAPAVAAEDMVAACVQAENDFVGAATGSMDQTVAVFARPAHALLIDFARTTHDEVPWDPPGELLVIDTRAEHSLVGGEYAERRRACEAAAETLGVRFLAQADPEQVDRLDDETTRRRARHVVTEMARVRAAVDAVGQDDWARLGELMTASHASLRDDYEVSCPELDTAVDAALEAGAVGARMTGGGFGGSAIALVDRGRGAAVREAVEAAYARRGFRSPRFLDGTAGGPAEAVRTG